MEFEVYCFAFKERFILYEFNGLEYVAFRVSLIIKLTIIW